MPRQPRRHPWIKHYSRGPGLHGWFMDRAGSIHFIPLAKGNKAVAGLGWNRIPQKELRRALDWKADEVAKIRSGLAKWDKATGNRRPPNPPVARKKRK